ncbi:hypothetical protein [Legionella qingyii]|uniref:hypothetical protein n=1 Tax=Legionella qingyii TaxID=2184757 RepID=UPI001F488543|nr:hypothetical protein [Legionella qingyii]
MNNPFYLAISSDNQEVIHAFNAIYCQLVSLLRNKYTQKLDDNKEKLAIQEYVSIYLQFYNKYSVSDNPFNKPLQELVALHPEFMEYFFQLNPQHAKSILMKDETIMTSDNLFKEHYYTQSLDDSLSHRAKVAITCHEDDWARPFYE